MYTANMSAGSKIKYLVGNVLNTAGFQRYATPPRLRQTGNRLFDLIGAKRNFGVGQRFARSIWSHWGDSCYWTITKVKPNSEITNGEVWGKLTWRGVPEPTERPVRSILKKQWREVRSDPLPFPDAAVHKLPKAPKE
eukprot:comp18957_c0_seq1/m.21218 comp18957_c0_seq1/g.21218  ORF comp18957_c0_seq1/g.21218 comp18957_c0_seq1/m.21218 type:complete len:137 (-) comp18957_c0_seq1:111-521(-)